jgi:hypothetical protein
MSDQPFGRSRRDFMRIAVTAGTTAALPWMQDAHAQSPANSATPAPVAGHSAKGTQLILLGTKGARRRPTCARRRRTCWWSTVSPT